MAKTILEVALLEIAQSATFQLKERELRIFILIDEDDSNKQNDELCEYAIHSYEICRRP